MRIEGLRFGVWVLYGMDSGNPQSLKAPSEWLVGAITATHIFCMVQPCEGAKVLKEIRV